MAPPRTRRTQRLPVLEALLDITHIDPAFEEDRITNYSQYSRLSEPYPVLLPRPDPITHMMSTRRTTRASSKAASSRGVSPAITEGDIPATPARRSSRRAGSSTPLPAIASRTSTAYGTNASAKPGSVNGPELSQPIDNVLSRLLEPVREEDTPSVVGNDRHGRAPAPRAPRGGRGDNRVAFHASTDRSYHNESGIFGNAGIESSSVTDDSEVNSPPFYEPVATRVTMQERKRMDEEQYLHEAARTPVANRVQHEAVIVANGGFPAFIAQSRELALKIMSTIQWIFNHLKTPLSAIFFMAAILLLAVPFLGPDCSVRFYGYDIRHNVGQLIPYSIAHPMSALYQNDIKDLKVRMKKAEYDIAFLKSRADMDPQTIEKLEKILPDGVVCKVDNKGNLEITQEFWHALEAKMRSENTHRQNDVSEADGSSRSSITLRQVESLMENSKIWDRYLDKNRAKIMAWSGEKFDSRFPEKLQSSIHDGVVASKSEFIDMIRKNWDDTQHEVKSEVRQLAKQLDQAVHQVAQAEEHAVGHMKDEIKSIASDVYKKMFSAAQLESLSKANMKINAADSNRRVNHFSKSTGAVVNPRLTSPNYVFPSMDRSLFVKGLMWMVGRPVPSPNPPEVALEKWDEHGECWCSPSKDASGFGPSLAVIMGNQIYPDQVVIEHVSTNGALEPGSVPREMELLAYIEDWNDYRFLTERSENLFYEEGAGKAQHPRGFVRIAEWTYDAYSLSNTQAFPLQIDLKKFGTPTNKLIVRSKNNWGGDGVDYTCLYRVRVNGDLADSLT